MEDPNWIVLTIFLIVGVIIFIFGLGYLMRFLRIVIGLIGSTWGSIILMALIAGVGLTVGFLMILHYGIRLLAIIG